MAVTISGNLDGVKDFLAQLKTLNEKAVYVGVPENENPEVKNGFNMASLAAVLEFGSVDGHIPSRPFLRQTLTENQEKYAALFVKFFQQNLSVDECYKRLALVVEADVKKNIRHGNWTPNAKSTIRRKKSSRPLIDTGKMRQSIRGIVK
ncbi:hypothetical protein BKK47_02630 [Rodentibacter mrazii]|uniref:Uncharacterized protein n=1 Tax=Rodentibacter mrazii TaxID=1908257 RepID=A0A1V3IJ89_9PAST|nr:hypothetical protein [Rodentibacter mrazii]OOF40943.1 hypothetical protein BKK47_02630 [Rodentibacter mrazii]